MSLAWDSSKRVENNVIRTESGRLHIYQCRPRITNIRATSQGVIDFQRRTIGDILQDVKRHKAVIKWVFG